MKLTRRSLILCAMLAVPGLHAEAPKPKALPSVTTKDIKPEDLKKMNEVHTLAVMEVSFGGEDHQIFFELFPDGAPNTVENFVKNVNDGIYKGMAFHRTIENYLVQTGDPASKNKTARDSWGLTQEYTIPGEFKLKQEAGSVAMARRGDSVNPDRKSDGTQFYFAVGDLSNLSGQYTVFGKVVSGMDSLKEMSKLLADSNDCPLERVEITKMKIMEFKGPLVNIVSTNKKKKTSTRSEALKGPFEKFLDRIW